MWVAPLRSSVSALPGVAGPSHSPKPPASGPSSPPLSSQVTGVSGTRGVHLSVLLTPPLCLKPLPFPQGVLWVGNDGL